MYKLMVSHNVGISYAEEATADTIEELLPRGKELDEQMLRWVIEDEEGKVFVFCDIHTQMMDTIQRARARQSQRKES